MSPVIKAQDHSQRDDRWALVQSKHLLLLRSCSETSGGKTLLFPSISVHSGKWKNAEERKVQGMVERFNNILGGSILIVLQKLAQH